MTAQAKVLEISEKQEGNDYFSQLSARMTDLFVCRDDITPQHWQKNGNSGYNNICYNKNFNKKNGCRIARGKSKPCTGCPAFVPVPMSESLLKQHIAGKRILGTYTILPNETAKFIAFDLDRKKDTDPDPVPTVREITEVCNVAEIPCYVLKSKSGKGFHVYIFLETPIPAWQARLVGCGILDEAGIKSGENGFDILFPNQSKLTGKKSGSLIALPFQGKAIAVDATVFLEDDLKTAVHDQILFMDKIVKVIPEKIEDIISEWKLQRTEEEEPERTDSTDYLNYEGFSLGTYSRIKAGCKFLEHAEKQAATLHENLWYIQLSIIARCKDSKNLAHKLSESHPKYTPVETEEKLEHAKTAAGPFRCDSIERIADKLGQNVCKECDNRNKITSPAVLGTGFRSQGEDFSEYIAELNKKHFLTNLNGSAFIVEEITDPIFNRPGLQLSSKEHFKTFYENRQIPTPTQRSPDKTTSIAELWLQSEERRENKGIVFSPGTEVPGYHNLWQGFQIQPEKGNWSLAKQHLFNNWCNKNKEHFAWLLARLAKMYQDPGDLNGRPGTSIILQGKKGTGKGFLLPYFGEKIFGVHYLTVTSQHQVTGNFNQHLKDVLLLFADEAFFAGNKSALGTLNAMISEYTRVCEGKYKDSLYVKNHLNIIMASNEEYVVPATADERRYFVLDVAETQMQNTEYFKAIVNQMNSGGTAAFLHDMLEMDISGINLRLAPKTEGLVNQIEHGLSPEHKFWLNLLNEGRNHREPILITGDTPRETHVINADTEYPCSRVWECVDEIGNYGLTEYAWKPQILRQKLYRMYLDFVKPIKTAHLQSPETFGKSLKSITKLIKDGREGSGARRYLYKIAGLEQCRNEFNETIKFEYFKQES